MKGGAFLLVSSLLCLVASVQHDYLYISGCSKSDAENMYGLDDEKRWYADFVKGTGVNVMPPFADPITFPGFYDQALVERDICRANLAVAEKAYRNPAVALELPHSSIYTMDPVELGKENYLICHVTGFHPAPVTVRWTRNDQNVSQGVATSVPYPNKDFTFNQFSHLKFTPEVGDIYSCTVEHQSLSQPLTRMWDVVGSQPSIGPTVFCGVGLTVGLLGVATGTFFLVKGIECN